VNDDLHVIEHDPLARREPVDGYGANAVVLQPAFNRTGDRFQVRLGRSRADNEEIGKAGDALQIEDDDIFCLLVRREVGAGFG
jgi:hypothetical protein